MTLLFTGRIGFRRVYSMALLAVRPFPASCTASSRRQRKAKVGCSPEDLVLEIKSAMPRLLVKLLNYMLASKPIACFDGAIEGIRPLHDACFVSNHDDAALGGFDWGQICRKIERIYAQPVDSPAMALTTWRTTPCIATS